MKYDTVHFAPCKQHPADYIEGMFWPKCLEQALPLQKVLISPNGVTTTDLYDVAESEGHANILSFLYRPFRGGIGVDETWD